MTVNLNKSAVVIGAGLAGISAATSLAHYGYRVRLLEKNNQAGGRARMLEAEGFKFDMGPSWYWMPDVIERYFNNFGDSVNNHFLLKRLDPSYQIIYGQDDVLQVPANYEQLQHLFESTEEGSAGRLDQFLQEAAYKYRVGMLEFAYKPSVSINEFASWSLIRSACKLDIFKPFSAHIRKYFKHPRIIQMLEFPILFLGALPSDTPALYSLMNYADIKLGTWYPMGGMHELVKAMLSLAEKKGVSLQLSQNVEELQISNALVRSVKGKDFEWNADLVVAAADYQYIDNKLLPAGCRNYTETYWSQRKMAPSCLIYYIGVGRKLPRLQHHNLFFEASFEQHARAIYETRQWPEDPLFYVSCPSVTDASVAPPGCENLFVLVPVSSGMQDSEAIKQQYFDLLVSRLEKFTAVKFSDQIIYRKMYAASDFTADYNAYKGNAYGLANTLMQTAFLKPSIRNKKLKNLFYAGQLTVPGPGVPPSIISGQLVAGYAHRCRGK